MPLNLRKLLRFRGDAMSSSSKKEAAGMKTKPPPGSKGPAMSTPSTKESKTSNTAPALAPSKRGALVGQPTGSPLKKLHYLSKSQETLTSQQKQQQQKSALQMRPKSSLGLTDKKAGSNKENVQVKGKDPFVKPLPFKGTGTSTPKIRKASSSQHIDLAGGGHAGPPPQKSSKSNMKKAQSTQNVSNKDNAIKKRTSATTDVMAYNVELLANVEKEKRSREAKISELIQVVESRKIDIEKYKYEIKKLKDQIPSHDLVEECKILRLENVTLREQLAKLGFPMDQQITDTEKLSLKQSQLDGEMKMSASYDSLSTEGQAISMVPMQSMMIGSGMKRSASITMSEPGISFIDGDHPSLLDMNGKWDSRSKSSDALSDISVANLTERIMQMEETHYSTNEELQATLQELGDLQDAVNELTEENERLADERSVLLESLCTQTEKLEHCRTQIEQLKCLLISGDLPNKSDRDQHLLGLLKGAQVEREEILRRQAELQNALYSTEAESKDYQEQVESVKDKVQHMEDKISGLKTEKETLEKQVGDLRESLENEYIEVAHFKTLLENEKSKVVELETVCKAAQQSDLEDLLHNARQERDKLEERLADVQDALAHSQKEVTKLKDQIISKEEEVKVSKNNAKSQLIDMEYTIQTIKKDRYDFQQEIEHLREHIDQLEQDSDRYFEERKNYTAQIIELQGEVSAMRQLKECAEAELQEVVLKHQQEVDENQQFQKDLQVAVVVSNEFRSETQIQLEKVRTENSNLKDKCQALQGEIDRLKSEIDAYKIQDRAQQVQSSRSTSILSSAELKGKVMNSFDKELSHMRDGKKLGDRSQTLSVKNLIRSIEDQVKSGCSSIHSSSCSSRRNSDSETSLVGLKEFHDLMQSPGSPVSDQKMGSPDSSTTPLRSVLKRSGERPSPLQRHSLASLGHGDSPKSPGGDSPKSAPPCRTEAPASFPSILSGRTPSRRSSGVSALDQVTSERKEVSAKDPLSGLAKSFKGSKRNALLKWCQQKTLPYSNVDITNFSSSWNDGLAFCALLHSFMPDKIPYTELSSDDKRRNFTLAFNAADSAGISSILNITDMVAMERPDWQAVFTYVTAIYKHFEVDNKS